jgi:hypothetical protein
MNRGEANDSSSTMSVLLSSEFENRIAYLNCQPTVNLSIILNSLISHSPRQIADVFDSRITTTTTTTTY